MRQAPTVSPYRDVIESPTEFAIRLQTWVEKNLRNAEPPTTQQERLDTTQAMFDEGFIGITWPVEYGGRGLTDEYQTEFNRIFGSYGEHYDSGLVTVGICAYTLLDYGSDALKTRHIGRMLRGDDVWTQLLSEPGAGSDLGGVQTRAVRDGDQWVISGQKVWTSAARESQYAIALVRTDPSVPKYAGLSMVVVPLDAKGVDIRPLRQMTGDSHFNEVFLDDVRVPVSNTVGAIDDGWSVLGRMLHHERMALSAGTVGGLMAPDRFVELLGQARGRGVIDNPAVRSALADIYVQNKLLEAMGRRMRLAAEAALPMGPVGSIGKLGVAKLARATAEAGTLIAGPESVAWSTGDEALEATAQQLLYFPMTAIAGGTTEIQRNVVAERVIGLPREMRSDRNTPFRDLPKNS